MDTAGNTWKQHLLAVGYRFGCMAVISLAGVVAWLIAFMVYSSTKAGTPTKPHSGRPMEQAVCRKDAVCAGLAAP